MTTRTEAPRPDDDHTYATLLEWSGSTARGYRSYPRRHRATARPTAPGLTATRLTVASSGDDPRSWVALSADAAFRGDAELLNPEQLLVMAASSCQLLSFLAVAARHGLDVVGYTDSAVGTMPTRDTPLRLTRIELAPVIRVAPGTDPDLVRTLVERAHDECYVARSLTSDVVVRPTVVVA
jgi:organic hydroperoxide reductase OsmC/OhrA